MAKINRFYLLIAAFICTHSYDASAGVVNCSNIEYLDTAEECYAHWTYLFKEGKLTRQEHSETFGGIDDNICDGWEDTGHAEDPGAKCQKLDTGNLADYCCKFHTNGEGPCVNVLLGWDTCESTDTGGDSGGDPEYPLGACDDEYAQGVLARFDTAIEIATEFAKRPDPIPEESFDGAPYAKDACDAWDTDPNTGNRECTGVIIDIAIKNMCDYTFSGEGMNEYCLQYYNDGGAQNLCYGDMPCEDGQYKSGTECLLCEAMRWIDKNNNEHDIKNVKPATTTGADSQADCYIPANTTGLEDATGYFSYTGDCPYYGS